MIDKKFKKKWLAALRSRKFKQGHRALHNGKGYCCLGVACVVAGAQERDNFGSEKVFYYGGDMAAALLPNALRKEIGLTNEEEEILYILNDGGWRDNKDRKPHKFGQIARWIERHL
jgi:hypothetical protein